MSPAEISLAITAGGILVHFLVTVAVVSRKVGKWEADQQYARGDIERLFAENRERKQEYAKLQNRFENLRVEMARELGTNGHDEERD